MILDWLVQIGLGVVGGLLPIAALSRRVWNLQCDLASTQAQLLKERNHRAANTRWKDKEALEVLQELNGSPKPLAKVNPLAKFGISR